MYKRRARTAWSSATTSSWAEKSYTCRTQGTTRSARTTTMSTST